jgi:hypothetical protein
MTMAMAMARSGWFWEGGREGKCPFIHSFIYPSIYVEGMGGSDL